MFMYPVEYDGDFTVVDIGIIVVIVDEMVAVVVVAVVDDGILVANDNSTEDVVDGD